MKKGYFLISMILCFAFSAQAQDLTITGTVTAPEDDSGLPGVNVIVKGTSTGTVTDINGSYSLQVPGTESTLVFSSVGFVQEEVNVGNNSVIDLVMTVDVTSLDEIVVVGYGSQKKATITGAVGSVKSEELLQRPVANTTDLLQGRVVGLYTRQASGLPGADGTTLNIRGYGSNPLVLIDGLEGNMSTIDPNDIESVSVLKDASAAIYGARAGNGVILVTTKRGSAAKAKITYHGNVSFTNPTYLPDLVEARKWAELLHESGLNPDDYSPNHIQYDPETKRLINTMDDSDYYGYDWDEELYRDWTPQHQHNLSATGGNDKVKYFVSAGFIDQASNFSSGNYDYKRFNVRSNLDAEITKNLGVSFDFSYRNSLLDKANFDVSAMYNSLQTAKPVYPVIHDEDPSRATSSGFLQRSPYHQTFKDFSGFQENRTNTLQGALELRYSFPFAKGLVAKVRFDYTEENRWNKKVSQPFDVWEYDPVAASIAEDPWVRWGTQNSNNMNVYSNRSNILYPLISLDYENTFNNHFLKVSAIAESRSYNWTSLQGSRKDILSFEAPYLIYASEEGKDNAENLQTNGNLGITQRARSSFIGRVNYDYLSKYMVEVTLRADASAEYPSEGRWGYFPSVSAGWRISEESFMSNSGAINSLKLRGSYGILGNDAVSSFDYLTGYTISTNFHVFGTTPAPIIASAGLANPNITWETMKMSNIGLEGTMWNGLLGFEIDAFYRLREDILAQPTEQVPNTFGASLPRTNLNKRDNRGIEIALTHSNTIGDFSYDITPLYAYTRGKFVELDENVLPVTGDLDEETLEFNKLWNNRYVNEGQWDDRSWGYLSDGFFMNQQQIDEHTIDQDQAENQTLKVGDLIYKDVNGDDYIDWRDQEVIGKSGLPKSMYSLDMGANYKGFSLRLFFQGGANYLITVSGSAAAPFSNESVPLSQHYDYRAIIGQDTDGNDYITNPDDFKLPNVTENGRTSNNAKGSDFWSYDAAYFRLKNVHFSYTLPNAWIENAGIANCMLYFSGTNLWSTSNLGIWKDTFDPEIPGANNRDYPPVKTMTLGLRLTL